MSSVRQLPCARRDLIQIVAYLGERSVASARRFRIQAEATFVRLAAMPRLGTRFEFDAPGFEDLRYLPVSKFPSYVVCYRPLQDGIEIVRVLHGARDIAAILTDADEENEDGEGEDGREPD